MSSLPVPADVFFKDFASDVLEYEIITAGKTIGRFRGLSNSDEAGHYIGFLFNDEPKLSVGSTVKTTDGIESFQIKRISIDRYNGQPQLLKAYY